MKIVFVGPSLPDVATLCGHGIEVRPPAAHGDVLSATRAGATAIGLIDGNFEHVAPVWHKEILHALETGVAVFRVAFERWAADPGGPDLADVMRVTLADLTTLSPR